MNDDFYCDEVVSGRTPVETVAETSNVLAFKHTRAAYAVHIVVIPKRHISSLTTVTEADTALLLELVGVVRDVAARVEAEQGACRVITNLGRYQESKHLHFHVISGAAIETE